MRRVVITGMGIYSCLGKNLHEVKDSLYAGKSGIIYSQELKDMGFRSALTADLTRPDLKGLLDRRARMSMAEQAEYAYMATIEALKNAKVDEQYLTDHEVGVIYGNDSSARATVEQNEIFKAKKDTMLIGSGYIFQSMNSTVTMNLSTIFKLRGINMTISSACASGSHSVGMAYLLISQGMQDMVIAGGAQELNHFAFASFDALGAFSIRESEPTKASRPFDKDRDGLIPSGGGASLVIESLESAQKRGATILGEIIGMGFSSNGEHISQSNISGPSRSIEMALKSSGIALNEIGYINAHATSTPNGDANEAQALLKIFGNNCPPVSSTKSMTGHECWMSGASSIVYSMLMMQNDFIAPNINFETPDENTKGLPVAATTMNRKFNVFLSNSFGFGGTNSTILVRKFEK